MFVFLIYDLDILEYECKHEQSLFQLLNYFV